MRDSNEELEEIKRHNEDKCDIERQLSDLYKANEEDNNVKAGLEKELASVREQLKSKQTLQGSILDTELAYVKTLGVINHT